MAENWQAAGAAGEVTEETPLSARVAGKDIGVYLCKGSYYALEDICPHAHALLSQGFVEGEEIECPLHGARFHIPSGRCTRDPAERDVRVYPVKIEGGTIYVDVSE